MSVGAAARCCYYLRAFRSISSSPAICSSNSRLARALYNHSILYTTGDLTNLIRVIDESGNNLGLMTKEQAERLAEDKRVDLTEVVKATEKNPNSVFKLLNLENRRQQQKLPKVENKKPSTTVKELTMKSQIDDNDLTVKSKKLQQFLDKDFQVTIKISKPRRATRLPRETFDLLVSKLHTEVKIMGAAKETDDFFRCTVVKVGVGKK